MTEASELSPIQYRAAAKSPPDLGAWLTLTLMIVATLLTAVDRNILVLFAESVGRTLALSDTQLGLLQGVGISLLASLVAIPIGWMADRYGHRVVVILCLLVWAAATVQGATTRYFGVLFVCTIGMGLGDSAFSPIVYSLIPRVFPQKWRFLANSIYAVANLLGLGVGVALAGGAGAIGSAVRPLLHLPSRLADWQAALLVAAMCAVPVALAVSVMRVGRAQQPATASRGSSHVGIRSYLAANLKTAVVVYAGLGLGGLGISAISVWLPMLLGREYGVGTDEVASWMAAVYLAGVALGAACGTAGVRLLRQRAGTATPVRTVAIACSLGAVFSFSMLLAHTPLQTYLLFGGIVTAAVSGVVLAPTMMQEMTPPSVRSSLMAAGAMVSGMITALGGPLVGLTSDALRGEPHGLRYAVVAVGLAAFLLAAALLAWIDSSYVRTVESMASAAE